MQLSGEQLIDAPRTKVWAALNDPAVLQACIPGCQAIEPVSATEMNVQAGGSAESGNFGGKILLSELDPPNGYTISGPGEGGFTNGGAKVTLAEAAGATRLAYRVEPEDKSYADGFFSRFATTVAPRPTPGVAPAPVTAEAQLRADGKPPESVLPGLEQVPDAPPPHDPKAHVAEAKPYHPPAHEDHDHDPSNPHYFGLPIGVIIAGTVAGVSVLITLVKFLGGAL